MHKKIYMITIAILCLSLAIIIFVNTFKTNQSKPAISHKFYSYKYETTKELDGNTELSLIDGKIVKIDDSGKEEDVIKSVREALPEKLNRECGCILEQIAQSSLTKNLYFSTLYSEGEGDLFKFDAQTKQLSELKSSDKYYSIYATNKSKLPYIPTVFNVSKDKSVEDGRIVSIVDLDNDVIKQLNQLPSNLTYNVCMIEGCIGGLGSDVSWDSDDTFSINVYDAKSSKQTPDGVKAKLVRVEKYKVN